MRVTDDKIKTCILDSIPYPIVFADQDHVIRYLNATAKHHYYRMRGYSDLIGKSLFDCHTEAGAERLTAAVERIKHRASQLFLHVTADNYRLYLNPVRDENGDFLGYFARYELNVQK